MVPIFDLHADVFMDLTRRQESHNSKEPHNAAPELEERHLRRMRSGGVAGAALIDCRMAGEAAGPEHLERFIAAAGRELSAAWPGAATVLRAADLRAAIESGAFAAVVGFEGLSATLGDIDWLWRLYGEAGLRVASLTHNDDNVFGGGALGAGGGLTEKGFEALAAMNKLGIMVDMAHAGAATRRDILAASTRPVMLSHTSCKAVYDTGRNLSDEALRDIADSGGLVGCMTSPAALAPADERANHTLERYMEHLNHMIGAAGVEHVGLGLHFCEYLYTREEYPLVSGLEDASRAQAIIGALSAAGYSENEVEKIAWRNFARVFEDAVG
jgi:membrane dipeptidase